VTPLLPHSLVAVIASVLTLACRGHSSSGPDTDPVLLELGDETVRRSDFERYVAAVQARGGGASLAPEVRQALLEPYLEERILVLEARARGLAARGDAEEKENESVRRLLSDAVLSRVTVLDAELDAYCREHARDFDRPERIRLRQILVPTSNEARDVVRRLKKDPKSFATLAQTRSRGPEASTGGSMGTFGRGELPAELEGAAFGLAAGETSDVVHSPLGYHVLRVDERVAASQTGLPQCREAARAELLRQKSDMGVREFVQGLMARAKVNHEAVNGSRPS
jgi:parvulin-like peptidyl-prolyl isomerase